MAAPAVAAAHPLSYWAQWQVLACAAILVGPAAAAVAVLRRMQPAGAGRSADMWLPCWRGLHPLWLLAYRACAAVVMTGMLGRFVSHDGVTSVFFYTQWTFALVIIYFVIATFLSARGCWFHSKRSYIKTEETDEFLADGARQDHSSILYSSETKVSKADTLQAVDFLERFMQIVYQTSAGAVMLTDLVFWGILVPLYYSEKPLLELLKDGMHSLNLVFLLVDTVLNNLPFPWYGMVYLVFWSFTYISFQWILHACCLSWWPYPFLELGTQWAPLWYLGIALIHIPCYFLYWLVVQGKNKYFPRLFPRAYLTPNY